MEALAASQGARYVERTETSVQEIRTESPSESRAPVPVEPRALPGHELAYDKGGTDLSFQRAVLFTGATGRGGIIDMYV